MLNPEKCRGGDMKKTNFTFQDLNGSGFWLFKAIYKPKIKKNIDTMNLDLIHDFMNLVKIQESINQCLWGWHTIQLSSYKK